MNQPLNPQFQNGAADVLDRGQVGGAKTAIPSHIGGPARAVDQRPAPAARFAQRGQRSGEVSALFDGGKREGQARMPLEVVQAAARAVLSPRPQAPVADGRHRPPARQEFADAGGPDEPGRAGNDGVRAWHGRRSRPAHITGSGAPGVGPPADPAWMIPCLRPRRANCSST